MSFSFCHLYVSKGFLLKDDVLCCCMRWLWCDFSGFDRGKETLLIIRALLMWLYLTWMSLECRLACRWDYKAWIWSLCIVWDGIKSLFNRNSKTMEICRTFQLRILHTLNASFCFSQIKFFHEFQLKEFFIQYNLWFSSFFPLNEVSCIPIQFISKISRNKTTWKILEKSFFN